jgi:hypothetical protein
MEKNEVTKQASYRLASIVQKTITQELPSSWGRESEFLDTKARGIVCPKNWKVTRNILCKTLRNRWP